MVIAIINGIRSERQSFWMPLFQNIPYLCEYQHIEEKQVFFEFTLQNRFLPISPKISKFKEKKNFMRFLWKNIFYSICPKISIFQEKLHYFEITLKKYFFYPYVRKYQHLEKNNITLTSRWRRPCFAISSKISKIKKKVVISSSFWKIVICPNLRKYLNFRKKLFSLNY